mmetsp:Transcript_16295/g.21427  ORF Transcript_16295/g.21427 Transcript_16295/m.21427 type:complete len:429 (+) Transcript_16295:102-1388(+)
MTELKKQKLDPCGREAAVDLFKDLLRFKTISVEGPKGEYARCCEFLKTKCEELIPGCDAEIIEPVKSKPIVLVKVPGTDPSLKGILLNSHYDVVPVMREHWDVDPWEAVEKDGKIYGRGTQDMKCVCAQYILAVARMVRYSKVELDRTIYLSFVPDEEIGGADGMSALISCEQFKSIKDNVGIALDEGLANTSEKFTVFYGERVPLWVTITANGPTGHGSRFIADTAVEKLIRMANKALEVRRAEEKRLGHSDHGCKHSEAKKLGEVMSLNLTVLQAGVSCDGGKTFSNNVIPTVAKAGFDIRVPPEKPLAQVREMLDEWTSENGMSWKFDTPDPGNNHYTTPIDESNPWWGKFKSACDVAKITLETEIFPAATDSRFLRECGLPAFGFSPMNNSPILLHEHNEYLDKEVFLNGIGIYETVLSEIARK